MNVIACIICLVLALTSSPDLTETKKASYRELCATLQELAFPQYPNDAVAAGLQGDVLVEIDIGKDGRITAAREQSGPAPLAAAARAAVLQWRFGKGPLAGSIPQQAEIIFRYQIGRAVAGLSEESDRLVIITPSEITEAGVINVGGSALSFLAAKRVQPPFPSGAQRQNMRVEVEVETTDDGRVLESRGGSGNPAYRAAAEAVARQWTFRRIIHAGKPVRLRGRLVFNWVVN